MNQPPEVRPPRSRWVAATLGALLCAALDVGVGAVLGAGSLTGGFKRLGFVAYVASHAALLGLAAGAATTLLATLLGRRRVRVGPFRPTAATLVVALGAAVVVEVLNWDLFRGGGVSARAWAPFVEAAFRVVAPLGVAAVVVGGAALATPRAGPRPRVAAGFVLAALLLLVANATLWRGQYPKLHLQLALAAVGAAALAVEAGLGGGRFDPSRTRARAAGVLLIAAAAVVLPLAFKHDRRFQAVRGVALERAFGVGRLAVLTSPWIEPLATFEDPNAPPDVSALLARLNPALDGVDLPDDALQRRLDAALPDRRRLSVYFVAVDTLRADRCGFLGFRKDGRSPTPELDRLAEEAFVFERAYAAYPTSSFSYNSVFTSLPARINAVFGRKFRPDFVYEPDHVLAGLLARTGRATAAVTAFDRAGLENEKWFKLLKDGFQTFNPDQGEAAAHAPEVTASATTTIDRLVADGRTPAFFWTHYLDPHLPYVKHRGFEFGDATTDWYLSEVAATDYEVGKLFAHLKSRGLWDDAIIVAFSDHGEEFGEHGGLAHDSSVYDEQIRVPLLIRVPGVKGRRVASTVSLLDVLPTTTRLLGIEDPVRRLGRSLLPLMLEGEQEDGGAAYAEVFTASNGAAQRALIVGRRKLVHRLHQRAYELYDLEKDPGERESLIGVAPDERELKALMAAWDRVIDDYHGPSARRRPMAPFDDLFGEMEAANARAIALAATDREAARAAGLAAKDAVDRLHALLLSSYGDVRLAVTSVLRPAQIDGIFMRLAEAYPGLAPEPAQGAMTILARRRDPRFAPLFRKEIEPLLTGRFEETRWGALEALLALAALGDQSAATALRVAYAGPDFTDKGALAVALARLGDLRGAEWFLLNLACRKYGWVYRDTLRATPQVLPLLPQDGAFPSASRLLRDRLTEEDYRDPEINLAYVELLRAVGDEDALVQLCRLGRNKEPEVRDAALEALRGFVPDAADLARKLEAAGEELNGDVALLNRQPLFAREPYLRALRSAGFYNAGLRFRIARADRAAGRTERAREALEDLAKTAPLAIDRDLAARRLRELEGPAEPDPAGFKCEVVALDEPLVRPRQIFAVHARLRNTGTAPWRGGWSADSDEILVRFRSDDGVLHEAEDDRGLVNRLPEGGVLPGEEASVHLLGCGAAPEFAGRMVLLFRNRRATYPNDGLAWTSNRTTGPASRPR